MLAVISRLASAGIAVVFMITLCPGPVRSSEHCSTANQLLEADLLRQAEMAYLEVINGDGAAECAQIGLTTIAERREASRRLYNAGLAFESIAKALEDSAIADRYRERAHQAYVNAVISDPENSDALTKLDDVLASRDDDGEP